MQTKPTSSIKGLTTILPVVLVALYGVRFSDVRCKCGFCFVFVEKLTQSGKKGNLEQGNAKIDLHCIIEKS